MTIEDPLGERAMAKAEALAEAEVTREKAAAAKEAAATAAAVEKAMAAVPRDPPWHVGWSPSVERGMFPPQPPPAGPMPWNWAPPNTPLGLGAPVPGDYWPLNQPPILGGPAPGAYWPLNPQQGLGRPEPGYWPSPPFNPPHGFISGPAPRAVADEGGLSKRAKRRIAAAAAAAVRHIRLAPPPKHRAPPSWEQIPRMLLPPNHPDALRSGAPAKGAHRAACGARGKPDSPRAQATAARGPRETASADGSAEGVGPRGHAGGGFPWLAERRERKGVDAPEVASRAGQDDVAGVKKEVKFKDCGEAVSGLCTQVASEATVD